MSSAADPRKALLAIGTLARAADHVGSRMEIPHTLGRVRQQRDELRALASCIAVLADQLAGDQAAS